MKTFLVSSLLALCGACGSATFTLDDTEVAKVAAPLDQEALLQFTSDWKVDQTGTLKLGGAARFDYDADRLPQCRGDFQGQPGWAISGFYQLNDGPVLSFEVGGHKSSPNSEPVIKLTEAGALTVWFAITNRWGCREWDSAYGANYHFTVERP